MGAETNTNVNQPNDNFYYDLDSMTSFNETTRPRHSHTTHQAPGFAWFVFLCLFYVLLRDTPTLVTPFLGHGSRYGHDGTKHTSTTQSV